MALKKAYGPMKTNVTHYLTSTSANISAAANIAKTAGEQYEAADTADEALYAPLIATKNGSISTAQIAYNAAVDAAKVTFDNAKRDANNAFKTSIRNASLTAPAKFVNFSQKHKIVKDLYTGMFGQ